MTRRWHNSIVDFADDNRWARDAQAADSDNYVWVAGEMREVSEVPSEGDL